jgi:uncharacterized iron-regulated protein
MMRSLVGVAFALAAVALVDAQSGYVPQRVFDGVRGRFSDLEAMLADLTTADVVLVGEQHDDPNTHRLELAILEGLRHRRGDLILSLEMFERDVQEPLEHFAMGHMSEEDFLKVSRPWPRYVTDYKPLVDFAIAHEMPIIAANVPRPIASEVSKTGLDALTTKNDEEKQWFAADLQCPMDDDYFKRFGEAMGDHPVAPGLSDTEAVAAKRQTLERFYLAQCLKDETMGESVARAWHVGAAGGKRPLVVQYDGAFHSDFGEGTAARVRRRLPSQRVVVLSMLPVDGLDGLAPDATDQKRADYLVYTVGRM